MTIQAHSVFASDKLFPVYSKYPHEPNPQRAFIILDIRTGEVDADYTGELGNAVPADVYHRQVLRFSINPMSTTDQINKMLNEHQAIFQAILAGAEVVWDGCNYAGRFTQDATALEIRDELLTLWGEQLYTGEALPESVAQALLEDGRCNDSAYLDELREFAGVAA